MTAGPAGPAEHARQERPEESAGLVVLGSLNDPRQDVGLAGGVEHVDLPIKGRARAGGAGAQLRRARGPQVLPFAAAAGEHAFRARAGRRAGGLDAGRLPSAELGDGAARHAVVGPDERVNDVLLADVAARRDARVLRVRAPGARAARVGRRCRFAGDVALPRPIVLVQGLYGFVEFRVPAVEHRLHRLRQGAGIYRRPVHEHDLERDRAAEVQVQYELRRLEVRQHEAAELREGSETPQPRGRQPQGVPARVVVVFMTELELGELARGRLAHDLAPEARDPHQMPGIPPAAVEERDARQSPEVDQVEQLVVGDLGAVEVQVEAAVRAGRELLGPLRELLLPLDEVDDARGRAQILDYHPAAVVEAGRVDALLVAEPRAVALGQLDARACLQVAGATDEPVLRRRRGPVR
eukprot:CAMPEP_0119286166 /NCGR_PEP_ID=MMETSP1329-20130426/33430_1 /TAXON_ID=114041 /ORGANISM="Genus nov. species nov., Strain RCC1024" /LENGTH=409 /DNA_ID=CAMNT_0007286895 /DNA_START=54 /DNA_END=1280 /DNA_ORIENTATION=+